MLQTAPQVFTTLIIGLLMAFAFQLVLTNLGIAVGVTALALQMKGGASSKSNSKREKSSGKLGNTIRTISLAAGFGILVTINIVLFAASFLSVRLSLIADPWLGAILGVVVWSAYLLILAWISSTTIGSLAGSVFSSLTAGLRAAISTARSVFNSDESEDEPELTNQMLRQEIREDVKDALSAANIQDNIQTQLEAYLKDLQPPQPDMSLIRRDLEDLLTDPALRSLFKTTLTSQINRQTFVDLLRDRTNLSNQDVEHIVTQLEDLWQQAVVRQAPADLNAELLNFLHHTKPEELKFDRLAHKLEELLSEKAPISTEKSSILEAFQSIDLKALMRTLVTRVDLSDLDIEDVWHQVQNFKQQFLSSDSEPSPSDPFNIIRADVENYLLSAYPWNLERKTVRLEFEDVIFDADADPKKIRPQLEQFSRDDFVDLLTQRNDISTKKISQIADRLESVRVEILQKIQHVEAQEQTEAVYLKVKTFFQTLKKINLKPKSIQRAAKTLLINSDANITLLEKTLDQFDRNQFKDLLDNQSHLQEQQIEEKLDDLETLRDRLLTELKTLPEVVQADIQTQWTKLESYLRHTTPDRLTSKNVKRKLQDLFKDSLVDVVPACTTAFSVEREPLVSLLKRRQNLTSDAIEQIISQIEETWQEIVATDKLSDKLSDQSSEHQQDVLRQALKAPRRWITRTKEHPQDFATRLHDYLQHSDLAELDLNSVQVNVRRLLEDFRADLWDGQITSFADLSDRHPQLHPTALKTALSQRQDMSDAQIETILQSIESTCNQWLDELEQSHHEATQSLATVLTKLQSYFDSLSLPDINADSVEQLLHQLLHIPKLGLNALGDSLDAALQQSPLQAIHGVSLEELRDRLQQFNRDTLASVLNGRDDISQWVSSRLMEQMEGTRDRLLANVETLQQKAQVQLEALKQEAQRQARATRKAAAIAAWWLFSITLTSGVTAAIAGFLAAS